MNRYIVILVTSLYSVLFIVFGLNKFLGFINLPLPSDPTAKSFLLTMFSSYLVKLVGFTQIIGAILLVIPRTKFVGTLFFLPVIVNIILFHLSHDNPGNGLWIVMSLMYIFICFSQKENFKRLIEIQ